MFLVFACDFGLQIFDLGVEGEALFELLIVEGLLLQTEPVVFVR
jgi:hypothetical protein